MGGTSRLRIDRGAVAITLICLLSLFLWTQPGLTLPDAAGYYVYLPSTWIDRDLLFFNEWQRLGLIRNGIPIFKSATATNHLGNHWTVGPALLWYPAYMTADAARAIIPSFRNFPRDGVVLPYNLAVVTGSALAGLGTLLLGYSIARRWFSAGNAAFAAIATWFGTTLLWYSVRDAAMSHAVSALACAVVVALSLRLRQRQTAEAAFSVGLALGFAALVRIQNAAFLFVPFLLLGRDERRVLLRRTHFLGFGGLLAVMPELVVSTIVYGHPLGFASIGVRAIGWHPWERFWGIETLFSWYHGLFPWTPIAAAGIVGLITLWRTDRRFAATGLSMFAIQWITNATADRAFWAALSFGARRFDNCTIFFLIGIAALVGRLPWRIVIAIGAVWTMLLFYVGRHVDLNAYQTFGELTREIGPALSDGIAPLMFLPSPMRAGAALTILFCLVSSAIILTIFFALPSRLRAAVAGLYFAAMTAFLAFAGANGAARIERYWPIIERSRAFAAVAGHEIGEQSLYENEILYLRKAGRSEEAARTEAELREVMRRRSEALRAAGLGSP